MAASKLHIFIIVSLFSALLFTPSEADGAVEEVVTRSDNSEALRTGLDKLTSKIQSIASVIDKKNQELKSKDDIIALKEKAIAEKEKTINDKSHITTSLPSEVASLKLEKLQMEMELKNNFRQAMEILTEELEKLMFDLYPKLQDSYEKSNWKEYGKPAFESFMQKALDRKAQAEKWVEPHVQTIKTKLVPAAREQWTSVITNVEPGLHSLTKKTKEVYNYIRSKDTVIPHMIKIKEVVNPHFQRYIGHIATATKHKAQETVSAYTKFFGFATKSNHQDSDDKDEE